MNVYGSSDSVKIRVQNQTNDDFRVLLYQSEIDVTAATYLTGAWRNAMVGARSTMETSLPIDMKVGAAEEGSDVTVSTELLSASQNACFSMYMSSNNALKIKNTGETKTDGSINVTNDCDEYKWAKVYKDGDPIISVKVRPTNNESIKIKPKLGMAIGENEVTTAFFDAATLSRKYEYDISNQSYLTLTITENEGSGKLLVSASYDKF